MSNLVKYFSENRYQFTYHLGDRVRGIWNGIPFTGTVQLDTLLDEYDGPFVIVYSDLPVKHGDTVYTMLRVSHENISYLK